MRLLRTSTRSAAETLLLAAAAIGMAGYGEAASEPNPPKHKATAALEERFGETYTAASRATANSKPRDIKAGDLPPVSLTDKPIDF